MKPNSFARCLAVLLLFAVGSAFAQTNCGVVPEKPTIIDGATASMEELVTNSQEVKGYIAEIDTFLDCYETFMQGESFAGLPENQKVTYANAMESILEARNAIGPEFNAQIQAYKDAQPAAE